MANNSDNFVIKLVLILFLSILPSLISLFIFRKVKQRSRSRLRRVQIVTNYHEVRVSPAVSWRGLSDQRDQLHNYLYSNRRRATTKYFLGDQSCQNNAHSPYIRCAINPSGPCDQCSHYEAKK
jgi:hypothetical protein